MSKLEKVLIIAWSCALFIVGGLILWLQFGFQDGSANEQAIAETTIEVPTLGEVTSSQSVSQGSETESNGKAAEMLQNSGQGDNERVTAELGLEFPEGEDQNSDLTALGPVVANLAMQVSSTVGCDHGETLDEVIENLRDEDFEVIVAFTSNGRKLFEQTDWSRSQAFLQPDQLELLNQLPGEILIHNHPNVDAPFSSNDLALLSEIRAGQGLVVGRNTLYSLRPRQAWGNANEMYDFSSKASELGPAYRQVLMDDKGNEAIYATNALLYYVADRFNLEYRHIDLGD